MKTVNVTSASPSEFLPIGANKRRSRPVLRKRRSGFSLAEVAIAMGIVTFSLVAVLGLLPIGLSSFREANEATIESQIISQISSEVALMPFSKIPEYAAAGPYYFDNDGRKAEKEADAIFSVHTSSATPNYPGKPATINADLVNLQVRVTTARNRNVTNKVHNLFVARSDRNP